jgi:hypothetical protein
MEKYKNLQKGEQEEQALFEARQKAKIAEKRESEKKKQVTSLKDPKDPKEARPDSIFDAIKHMVN